MGQSSVLLEQGNFNSNKLLDIWLLTEIYSWNSLYFGVGWLIGSLYFYREFYEMAMPISAYSVFTALNFELGLFVFNSTAENSRLLNI